MMAADSDGCSVTTVVTCEGDLSDPGFPGQFELVLSKLRNLLGDTLKVRKLEPWNSVRVTLSIPREAALRLRQLATDGSQQLRALGILSVQVEGDQVISLRLAGSVATEPQEIILQTGQDGSTSSSSTAETNLSQLLTGNAQMPDAAAVSSEKVQFRSPNVVCPPDTIVPKVPMSNTSTSTTPPSTKAYVGPFPFTSMNQAMHSRDNLGTSTNYNTPPPPPYPGKHSSVNISSPLLVNLLQTEGAPSPKQSTVETDGTQSVLTTSNPVTVSPVYSQGSPTVKVNKSTSSPFVQKTVPTTLRTVKSLPASQNSYYPQANSSLHSVIPNVNSTLNKSIISQSSPTSNSSLIQSKQVIPSGTNPQAKVLVTHNSTTQNNVLMSTPVFRQNSLNPKTSVAPSQASPVSMHKSHDSLLPNTTMQSLNSGVQNTKPNNNIRVVPYRSYPPPYPSHQWEQSIQQMPQLQELTPTLTDLKTDLDHLLPSLEQDLVRSPPEIPEELTTVRGRPTYLINPLTGELEPQSCNESEEDEPGDVFRGLPSPTAMSDEDTNSTTRPDTTDQSDSESRSCHSDSGKHMRFKRNREKGRDSPNLKQEKIKLRLKLEKSEPVSPAYKVDVSFINTQPKKAVPGEELRVPPLHISLRGRNAVINNKKKIKLNPDGTPMKPKARKIQDHLKPKKDLLNNEHHLVSESESVLTTLVTSDQLMKNEANESKKMKKPKLNHDHRDKSTDLIGMELSKHDIPVYNSHFKEKLKERRGSDSELARSNKKYNDSNGILSSDKKRRLSQTEESQSSILGSTNIGTVSSLSTHKPRKDKFKFKESFKSKDLNRYKTYSKNIAEKLAKQVMLPVGDMDMEAKFKQRLMEEPDRIAPRIPHRTESDSSLLEQTGKVVDLIHTLSDPPALKDKPPESDKCNTPDRKPDLSEKQASRSPNSGAQGEDSGIESMDALSEKSPNQASQSPHADMPDSLKPKTQVPDMLDIEAQLAKMEGFTGEDLNENHNNQTKEQCCGLQDGVPTTVLKDQLPQVEVSLVPLKSKPTKEEDLDPLPVRVTPPLYTYSNPDKGRGSESPSLSDSDSNPSCTMVKSKSLLEQLLIDIPENQTPSSPSPAARSVRTRASSKLNSPELNSPVVSKQVRAPPSTKRKRNESDSSNNSIEDTRNKKPRKCTENTAELIKACIGVDPTKTSLAKKKVSEESSDSDEPLIEVAGKVRKNSQINMTTPRAKLKPASNSGGGVAGGGGGGGVGGGGGGGMIKTLPVNTRRSVRAIPALNTRSKGDKSQPDVDILRRKTRSAVSEGEGKRRKDVK